jgi:hypothetical protein
MGLIPVNLCALHPPIRQTNCRYAFQLAPLARPELLPQNCPPANGPASRNDLDLDNLAEQLERHDPLYATN